MVLKGMVLKGMVLKGWGGRRRGATGEGFATALSGVMQEERARPRPSKK